MSDDQAYEVPFVEQLRSIPKDYRTCRAIQWSDDGRETGHQLIPVGFMMHRAADEIERLKAAASPTEADQRDAARYRYAKDHLFVGTVHDDVMDGWSDDAIDAAMSASDRTSNG